MLEYVSNGGISMVVLINVQVEWSTGHVELDAKKHVKITWNYDPTILHVRFKMWPAVSVLMEECLNKANVSKLNIAMNVIVKDIILVMNGILINVHTVRVQRLENYHVKNKPVLKVLCVTLIVISLS